MVRLDNFNIVAHLPNVCNGIIVERAIAVGLNFPACLGVVGLGHYNAELTGRLAILIGNDFSLFKKLFHMESFSRLIFNAVKKPGIYHVFYAGGVAK